MSHLHLPGMRYTQSSNDDAVLLDQQQQDPSAHSIMEKDVMRLLPPTWKKDSGGNHGGINSGFYPGADFGQSFDGFRVRPHMQAFQQDHYPPLQQQQQQQQQQTQHNVTHQPFSSANYTSPMFYNNNDNGNNNVYFQQPPPPPPPAPAQQHNQREAILTEVLKPRPMRKRRRPPHSYASLIAQAILTSQEQRMTLREIYEWVQSRYPHLYESNETGWQNTIRHNLSLNRCFRKLPRSQDNGKKGTKGGYWTVDVDQLNNTNFGRQILDSGFLGSIEYWHQEQEQQQQQMRQVLTPSTSTSTSASSISQLSSSRSSASDGRSSTATNNIQQQPQQLDQGHQSVEEIDFNSLVPFYSPQQQARHYTTDMMDAQRSTGFFPSDLKRTYDNLLCNGVNGNSDSSMTSTSSKTSSVRGATSPGSPETDPMSTPTYQALHHFHQHRQQQQNSKIDKDSLLNPSLMRVNNILN